MKEEPSLLQQIIHLEKLHILAIGTLDKLPNWLVTEEVEPSQNW